MRDREKAEKKAKNLVSFISVAKRIFIFAVLVTGTAFALRPIQLELQSRMEKIRDDFIARAENFAGKKIQYGSIGSSIFGMLDIRDILVLREDDSVLLSVSRLRLSYSIVELIRGNFLSAFKSVRIDRPVLDLDFDKDSDLAGRFALFGGDGAPENRQTPNLRELFPGDFSLRIWNGGWDLSGSAGSFRLRGVGLEASIRRNRISFQGRWNADGALRRAVPFLGAGESGPVFSEAAMNARFSGEYSPDTKEGSAAVTIPSLTGDTFRLKPLTISFFLSGSRLEARKTHDRSPAAISVAYDLESRKLEGKFEGENFSIQDLFSFTGSWTDYNALLAARISGGAGFEREAPGDFRYTVNFSGGVPDNAYSGPASLTVKAAGNKDHVQIDELDIRSVYGEANFRGAFGFSPLAANGSLSVSEFTLRRDIGAAGSGGLSGNFFISTRGREINVFGENVSSGGVELSALDGSLFREEDGLAFALSILRFRNIESYEDVRMGTVSLEGSMDYDTGEESAPLGAAGGSRHIQATLRLDSFSVGDIIGFAGPLVSLPVMPPMARSAAEDLSVTTEVFFTTDYEHILYNAPRIVAAYEGFGGFLAAASLSGTNRRFELNEGRVSWENGNATISGSVDFSDPSDISFSLGAAYRDLTYFFEGMFMDRRNLSIRGSYGFEAYLSAGETGTYSGFVEGDAIPLPSGDKFASASFLVSLLYESPAKWRADIARFDLTGLTTPTSTFAVLRFSGAADENGMNIPDFFFDDGKGVLGGDITLDWDNSYSYCRYRADISGSGRNENYSLNGTYRKEGIELYLSGQGMQFSRVSGLNAVADGNLRLSWESFSSFEAETTLSSLVLYRQDEEIRASAEASINADSFYIRRLNITHSGLEVSLPFVFINRAASLAEVDAVVRGNLSGRPVNLDCRAEARFNPSETWLDALEDLRSLDGTLTVNTARFDTITAKEPFGFVFSCLREETGFALNLSGGPRNMLRFRYSPEAAGGSFYAALSAPSPVRGSVAGSIDSKNIDARGTDLYVDMESLWRFVPPDIVVAFPGGIVTASVRVFGPLGDPEFYGTARGTSVRILVPEYLPEPIRTVPITFQLSGSEMTFGPVDASVGKGAGRASGWFRFDQWIPDTFSIDIQVPQETPIPYDFDISGVLAHGLVSGKLVVAMEDSVCSIGGDLTVHDTEISVNANEMAALENDRGADSEQEVSTVSDISVRAGRRVEFFWPSAEFPVIQAYPDMGTGIRVTSDDAARRFTLTGDLNLRSGELFYLSRNFYIKEGTLFFNESEVDFNPYISARAEIRDQAESGPVTISLIIDSAPLMSFTPRFVSNPPLSQMEIYSLLGQNPQGEAADAPQENIAAVAVTDILTQFTVMRRLQRTVRDFLGLDMFSVRTQLLQNVVLQAAGGQNEEDTVDKPYRVGNYFDNTTVFIGKYFGADMFGHAMFSFKYDEHKQTYGGIVWEPEIGLEMRNPLFDVHFNMVPLHPENWFINDISFSLMWRRSF